MALFSIYLKNTLADSTLMQMKKADLVKYVRMCERNMVNAYETLDQQAKNFEKLLAEQSKTPKGHWIKTKNYGFYCSNCKRYSDDWRETEFCKHCGCDMRG